MTEDPSPWILRWGRSIPAGSRVLDVACGRGRHACWFAGRGHRVTAVDRDPERLEGLPEGIEGIAADLENGPWPLPGRTFTAVVVARFLWRPLFPGLLAAVEEGGVLLYETFAAGNERYGRPRHPDHLLREGELLDRLRPELEVVAYEHGIVDLVDRTAVVQRVCARRGPGPWPVVPD